MAYTIENPSLGYPKITDTSTTKAVALGTRVRAYDPTYGGGEFIYLLGVAGTTAGDWVTYGADDFQTAKLAANAIGAVAIAMSANVAAQYGWYQIYGKAVAAHCLTAFADDGRVFATASIGYVDDASVTGDLVQNALGASTSTARAADFDLWYPYVNDASSTLA
jgi:hypothetical protein